MCRLRFPRAVLLDLCGEPGPAWCRVKLYYYIVGLSIILCHCCVGLYYHTVCSSVILGYILCVKRIETCVLSAECTRCVEYLYIIHRDQKAPLHVVRVLWRTIRYNDTNIYVGTRKIITIWNKNKNKNKYKNKCLCIKSLFTSYTYGTPSNSTMEKKKNTQNVVSHPYLIWITVLSIPMSEQRNITIYIQRGRNK